MKGVGSASAKLTEKSHSNTSNYWNIKKIDCLSSAQRVRLQVSHGGLRSPPINQTTEIHIPEHDPVGNQKLSPPQSVPD